MTVTPTLMLLDDRSKWVPARPLRALGRPTSARNTTLPMLSGPIDRPTRGTR
jgi:hypothetical protein